VALSLTPLDDARNASTLIHPFDRFARSRRRARVRPARTAHALALLSAALASRPTPWFTPHALVDARVDVIEHQLVATIVLLRGLASRVCVMDDVGTGKTVHAGIAIAELLRRGLASRVLIVVPPQLRAQWAGELSRLGVAARVLDARGRDEVSSTVPADISPWSLPGTIIASVDFVKRADTLVGLEGITWDIVVIDEAHHASANSDRQHAVDGLARRARHVLVLSATPHDGDDTRHRRLLGLGGDDPIVVVRRQATRREKRVHHLAIQPSDDERTALDRVERYREAVARCDRAARVPTNHLVAEVLARRADASMFALARTARRRRDALDTPDATQALLFADTNALPCDDDEDDGAIAALLRAPGALDVRHERALLGAIEAAASAAARSDTLVRALARFARRMREPFIVFAEHREALVPVHRALSSLVAVEVLHGGCSSTERTRALAAFTTGRAHVLLATDTAAEGLNLHARCRVVIHLDAPWTPTRLAQREGRVDRYGQARRVHAWRLSRRLAAPSRADTRLRARASTAAAALAGYGDVPVLVERGTSRSLPAVLEDAREASAAVRAERLREPRRRRGTLPAARELRSRVAAIDRRSLPGALGDCRALILLHVTLLAGPVVVERRSLLAGIWNDIAVHGRGVKQWARWLAEHRHVLEHYAAGASSDHGRALVGAEALRRRTVDVRLDAIDTSRDAPLAAHFIQQSLFDTHGTMVRAAADHAPRVPWPPLIAGVDVDVPLILVPSESSRRQLRPPGGGFAPGSTRGVDTDAGMPEA